MLLGAAEGESAAQEMIRRHRAPVDAKQSVDTNVEAWARRLGTIKVKTPEPTFDVMTNRWALYQALSCRMWARSALYQSSGAFGFRDQLQDAMAFVYAEPAIAREHIVARVSAAVRRGRRAALVASAQWARRAHAILGRSRLAAVRRRSLRDVSPAIAASSTTRCRISQCGSSNPDEHEIYDLPQGIRTRPGRSTSTACARSEGRARRACTACR